MGEEEGYKAASDVTRIVIAVVTAIVTIVVATFTIGAFVFKPYSETLRDVRATQEKMDDKLDAIISRQAVIGYKIDSHITDTQKHNGFGGP